MSLGNPSVRIASKAMGKLLLVIAVVLIGLTLFGLLGESLPQGTTLRGIADSIRGVGGAMGDMFGDMFGGGYGAVTPG